MDNAPERIWAFYAPEIAENEDGATIVAHENIQHGAKEYVRTDLHDATKAQLAKAVEALMEARLQLIYIDQLHRNGTTQTILARIIAVLDEIDKGAS